MRIDLLYESFNSLNNTHQGGHLRPNADFIPRVKEASLKFFNALASQETKSEMVQSVLVPFVKKASIIVEKDGSDYIAKYPKDYKYYKAGGIITISDKTYADEDSEVWSNKCVLSEEQRKDFFPSEEDYQRYPLTKVFPNQWNGVLAHKNRKPTFQKAYIVQRGKGFEVAPISIGVIVIDYYRLPNDPVYNYTEENAYPDVFIRFKEDQSKHLEWGDEMMPAFLYELSRAYGYITSDELKLQVTSIDKSLL